MKSVELLGIERIQRWYRVDNVEVTLRFGNTVFKTRIYRRFSTYTTFQALLMDPEWCQGCVETAFRKRLFGNGCLVNSGILKTVKNLSLKACLFRFLNCWRKSVVTDFVRLREAFSNYLRLTLGKSCEWMVQDWLDIVEITEKEAKV